MTQHRRNSVGGLLLAILVASLPARAAAPDAKPTPEQEKFFEQKVRPLLVENCFSCHGEKKAKGGLRLDSLAAIKKGGKNGEVLVPGKPEESKLVTAVTYKDEELQMPPDEKLPDEQVAVLTQWVAMGAPWPAGTAKISSNVVKSKKRVLTEDDRRFWSFQPPAKVEPPAVTDAGWCRTPIDKFILAKLQAEGLAPAPEADRRALIRRLTFDLHGLPPTPAEVDAFINDASPTAYETLVDRLLASPRYGEHWARHWLDLVRYAESDGFKQDAYRPNAWPYRDYVIDSFNADKPYDRFITEQIAGDEIAPNDPKVTVATGYFRHGVYEYNQRDVPKQWAQIVDDCTDVTGDVMLGLSMGCAHCHDHKFDPILQADYYRLRAFFTPMLPRHDVPLVTPDEWAKYRAADEAWRAKAAPVLDAIAAIEGPATKKMMQSAIDKFPDDTQVIMRKAAAERTPYESQIAALAFRQVNELQDAKLKFTGAEKEKYDALKLKLAELEASRPKRPLMLNGITDVGPVAPPTYIPGHEQEPAIEPGYLAVLEGQPLKVPEIKPTDASTGRRTALAKWLTQPDHPLVTRVIVNRIWQYHFGKGLVQTSSDYGRLGTPPTHPELLDYLARRFVADGWSFKSMHRLILLSSAYRQSAVREMPAVAKMKDPENRWLWRQNTRRLDAEEVRDSMLAVSGELVSQHGGPGAEPTAPHRSVYTKVLRNTRDPLLELFDSPETYSSVPVRNCTTTSNQALLMINGDWPLKRAAAFAGQVRKAAGGASPTQLVDAAYRMAYGRPPTGDEVQAAFAFLNRKDESPVEVSRAIDAPVTQTMPQRGGQAILVRNANPADIFKVPEKGPAAAAMTAPNGDFTVEAYVQLESLYPNAEVRVIASQWDGDQKHAGWALGVTCEKSKHQPRNLILQVTTPQGYEVIPSDMRIELHKSYYVAVAYKADDTTEAAVTFYLKDLTDMDAPLRVTNVAHKLRGSPASTLPLVIGGRAVTQLAGKTQGWDGLIDEVRVSHAAIKPNQILYNDGDPGEAVSGHWLLKEPGFFKDATGRHPDLVRLAEKSMGDTATPSAAAGGRDAALIDFCHILLNSNEFLYTD